MRDTKLTEKRFEWTRPYCGYSHFGEMGLGQVRRASVRNISGGSFVMSAWRHESILPEGERFFDPPKFYFDAENKARKAWEEWTLKGKLPTKTHNYANQTE